MSGQPETTLNQGQRPERDKTASSPKGPQTWLSILQGNSHTSSSKRILPQSQSPSCCLHPVPAGAPPRKTLGTPGCRELGRHPLGVPTLTMLPCQGCRVLPVETGLSPSPSRSHSPAEPKVYRREGSGMTTRLFQFSTRAAPRGCPTHSPHPSVGPSLRHQGEIPRAVPMLPEPRPRQSRGRKPSPFSLALCRGARAHPARTHGPGWGLMSLVGKGTCLVSRYPHQSSPAEQGR